MPVFKPDKKTIDLFSAILTVRTPDEAAAFFRDLCTKEELVEMADRWAIARLVAAGRPYREIAARLKTSTTTVSRVAAWLNGDEGGYRLALSRLGVSAAKHHHKLLSKKSL